MMYDFILKNAAKHITLNAAEINFFTSLLQYKTISRKSFVLREGQLCNAISYVHSGALRAYYSDKECKESTIMFAIADWWVTDMYCFANRLPAMLCIDAIEDSVLFQLTKDNMEKLFEAVPKFERFFRIIMQNAYIREQLRIIENLSLTAEERYINFTKKYPQVMPLIKQKQLASYLGISPEFLSVIRSRHKRMLS